MAMTVREKVSRLLERGGQYTAAQIARRTRSSPNTVRRVLGEMTRAREISKIDEGRSSVYTLGEIQECKVCGRPTPRSYCSPACIAERMANMVQPPEAPKVQKTKLEEGERECLRCERIFQPQGKDNWLCPSCRNAGVNILGAS